MTKFFVAFFILISNSVLAESECKTVVNGTGFHTFASDGKFITYKLLVESPNWSAHGYGYHGTAAIVCESCPLPGASWGLVHLSEIPKSGSKITWVPPDACFLPPDPTGLPNPECQAYEEDYEEEEKRPPIQTAKERVERGQELLYYPLLVLNIGDLSPVYSTNELAIDDMRGYGVVYKIVNPEAKGISNAVNGLIAFELHDSCASFGGTIAVTLDDAEGQLLDLMSSISIEHSYAVSPKE